MMLGFSLCILCIKLYTCLFFFYCGIIRLLELDYKFKDLCIIQLILGWFFFSFCFNSFICIERNKKKKMIRTMFNFFFSSLMAACEPIGWPWGVHGGDSNTQWISF